MIKKFYPVLLIILISIAVIFYKFNDIPKNLAFDEVEFARLALSLEDKPYQPYLTLATGHSTLYFYVILLSLKIFGISNFALRFPAAFFGVLSTLFFYLIVEKVFNKQKLLFHLLLAIIFLTSRWFFNFARFSFEATFLLFLELTSIYFFIRTVPRLKRLSLILSGLFAGLAFNSYTPGRIFFLLPLSFLLLKKWNKSAITKLLYFLIPFIIVITPLSLYLSNHSDTRVDQLFFWKNRQMSTAEKINETVQNIISIAGMFAVKGDLNGRHNYPGKPALNPIIFGLFFIGLIYSIKNLRKNFYFLFFIFYLLLSLAPSIPIYPWENPSMLRAFTVIPAIVYFVGQGIIVILNFFFIILSKMKNLAKRKILISCFLFLVVLFSSFYELRTYFKYQSQVFPSAFEIKVNLKEALKQTGFKLPK